MKILYLITLGEIGGAQTHVLELVRRAISLGDTAGLIIGNPGPLSEATQQLGAKVIILSDLVRPVHPLKDLRALQEVRSIIRTFQPDIVHAHSSKAGIIGRLAAKLEGVPCLFTVHGWAFSEGVPLSRKTLALISEKTASHWADRIITVSNYDRNLALRYGVAESSRMLTIYNGVEDTLHRANPGGGKPVVLTMVGRFSPQKNQEELISALPGLTGDFRVDFVGDGPLLAKVDKRVKQMNLEARVKFLGSRSDIAELLAKSQVFVLTSKMEGLPISILEAMRAGLPVVASDVGGIREMVSEGETGFLVPQGDIVTLRARLNLLIDNASLRVRMGKAGRCRYEQYFTSQAMLQKTWKVYNDLRSEQRCR